MISFERLSQMAMEENFVASVLNCNTGVIMQSSSMKSLIKAIKSDRHWEYTCKKYPWRDGGNENTTTHLFFKIGTASGVHYVIWFNIVDGVIIDKGFKCVNKKHLESVMYRNAYCYFTRT